MADSQLGGSFPKEIGRLNNLKFLRLFYNGVTGTLPEGLFQIGALEKLIIHGNDVSKLVGQGILF